MASFTQQLAQLSAQNSALSQQMAREQMQFQADQAAINRKWQEKMSNTAHQRQVKDLQAAGLNPILSVNSGAATGSASNPQGASGTVDNSAVSALASLAVASMNIASNERMQALSLENALKVVEMQSTSAQSVADTNLKGTKYGSIWTAAKTLANALEPLSGIEYGKKTALPNSASKQSYRSAKPEKFDFTND